MSDAAQTPLADLVKDALDRMEAGARIITDSIPGDTSLSSYSHGPDIGKAIAARIRLLEQQLKTAREALEWYGEQTRLCRLIHSGGDPGRHALSADGGNRAAAAIRSLGEKPEAVTSDSPRPTKQEE